MLLSIVKKLAKFTTLLPASIVCASCTPIAANVSSAKPSRSAAMTYLVDPRSGRPLGERGPRALDSQGYGVSSLSRSKLPNVGGPSQSSAIFLANASVSGRPEFSIAFS